MPDSDPIPAGAGDSPVPGDRPIDGDAPVSTTLTATPYSREQMNVLEHTVAADFGNGRFGHGHFGAGYFGHGEDT